ncbi:aldehyde dehydrogenase family protein [Altererythrobacter sp. ZODW24]|uniref:aldehyde dehydrogenase family protein n=1 Tax=Altererythrobacter sp. ZODW24 TaxID=2185142 RepID=UPI000DF791EC
MNSRQIAAQRSKPRLPKLPLVYVMGGSETGQALVGAVDYVCFTGSTETGRKIAVAAANALIPVNLELGGKDPMTCCAKWAGQMMKLPADAIRV